MRYSLNALAERASRSGGRLGFRLFTNRTAKGAEGLDKRALEKIGGIDYFDVQTYVDADPAVDAGIGMVVLPGQRSAIPAVWVVKRGKVIDPINGKNNLLYSGMVIQRYKVRQMPTGKLEQLAKELIGA